MISSVSETICNARLGLVGEQRQKSKKWGGGGGEGHSVLQNTPSQDWNFSWRT